jgi:hypothetical protein
MSLPKRRARRAAKSRGDKLEVTATCNVCKAVIYKGWPSHTLINGAFKAHCAVTKCAPV